MKEGGVENYGKVFGSNITELSHRRGAHNPAECVKNVSDVPVLVSWDRYGIDSRGSCFVGMTARF